MIIVYSVMPIDQWAGWRKPDDVITDNPDDVDGLLRGDFEARFEVAKKLARNIGWEGDMREGPYVSAIPCIPGDYCVEFLIAWKQDNNGQTFIASPFDLPWVRPHADALAKVS